MTQSTEQKESTNRMLRWLLASYFLLVAGVIAYHLKPLPEQKPVIEFAGFLAIVYCVVFAVLVIRKPGFWLFMSLFLGLPGIAWTIHQKNRYLAMALEESVPMTYLPWTLIIVALLLFIPACYRIFSDKSWSYSPKLKLFKKGVPF